MPSTRVAAVAVALLVASSGCSMLACSNDTDQQQSGPVVDVGDPPDHHEVVFASYTGEVPFEATVTVEADNRTLYANRITSNGTGHYSRLTNLSAPGPYQVSVNTTIPAAGNGTLNRQFSVEDPMGNATVVRLTYTGLYNETLQLPRRPVQYPLGARTFASESDDDLPMPLDIEVTYRGEVVTRTSGAVTYDETVPLAPLNRTGVYHVRVDGPLGTETAVVLVSNSGHHIFVKLDTDGGIEAIRTRRPSNWLVKGVPDSG